MNFVLNSVSAIICAVNVISPTYENPKLKAAGSLLYATNPADGQKYVLLSKERIWDGPSSGRWKGFGGKKESHESLIETVLRETKEESREVINYSKSEIPFDQLIGVEHYQCKYLQLMLPIDFDPSLPQRFQDSHFDNPFFMEKTEVRWIALDDLIAAVREADAKARDLNVRPFDVEASIQLDGETLSLAHDFTETMAILLRESPETLDRFMRDMPYSSTLVSDQNW